MRRYLKTSIPTVIMFGIILATLGADGDLIAAGGAKPSTPDGHITVDLHGGTMMDFVWIKPGSFLMGSTSSELNRGEWEDPQHEVTISKGFYLGKFEITQAQWIAVMGTAPWTGKKHVEKKPNHPAVYISWTAMEEFLRRLNEVAAESLYRLPTEAEWEYACRAGSTTRRSYGDDDSPLGDYAWYVGNTHKAGLPFAQPVGTKLPNPWGLYDMYGNVWEWVQDWYGDTYASLIVIDPTGVATGSARVMRGGGFVNRARNMRSAKRFSYDPSFRYSALGARLVRTK
jgi:formylglycine-generating enzyme required for sulfatase activity